MNALAHVMNPIDRALAALSDAMTDLIASTKPSRFAEIDNLARIACQLQRQRPAAGVDDVEVGDDVDDVGDIPMMANPIRRGRFNVRGFNDGADISREILMLAQGFLKSYMEAEQKKASKPEPDVRLNVVMELSDLMGLRLRLMKDDEPVPEPIHTRIDHLLKKIGEPPHAPQPDYVSTVPADDLRGHPPDGTGEPDRDRVGEPVAERARGDLDGR